MYVTHHVCREPVQPKLHGVPFGVARSMMLWSLRTENNTL